MYAGRILIVEDDPCLQHLLQVWLRNAGYETLAALDGEQGVHSLSTSTFDLALVDYHMPKMDGLEVLGEIAEHHIPVGPVLLTASHNVDLLVEAMRRGALDCVLKPAPKNSLLVTLDEALERHWARQLGLPLPSHLRARNSYPSQALMEGVAEGETKTRLNVFEPFVANCRVCGCDDLNPCVSGEGDPCRWEEVDLCSTCVKLPLSDRLSQQQLILRMATTGLVS